MNRVLAVALSLVAAASFAEEPPTLKSLMPPGVRIGAAVNQRVSDAVEAPDRTLVLTQFDSITPENLLKWEVVHPEPGRYEFGPADRYVEMGSSAGLFVVGHALVWHQQTPKWVFEGQDGKRADRETLLARMREHIRAVAGRYRGKVHGWDVVNEAFEDDGTLRKTGWSEIIGPDFIEKAFEFAREAAPEAELYYNDYNLWKPAKREAAERLVESLKAKGIRIDAVGEQAHYHVTGPSVEEIERVITALAARGVKVMLTELDIDVLPSHPDMWGADLSKKSEIKAATNIYPNGLPSEEQAKLAARYGDLFRLVKKHSDVVSRVTFWGVTDRTSWLNNFPIPGRVNYPLLFDRDGKAKPAFDAVVAVLRDR